jgi:cell division septation protein DedD
VTVRGERGDRESRPVGPGFYSDSDTGMWAAEWQAAVRGTTAFVRYSGRENVEHLNETGSYDQRDALAQIYANVTRGSQIFGTAMLTHTATGPGGSTYWQTGGGAQVRMGNRDLWVRGEGTVARNMDLLTGAYVPRESLIVGVNGQMSRSTTLGFNVNLDRTPVFASAGSPWVTRSMIRVTRNLPTGSVYMANTIASAAAESGRGTGTVSGLVFADWNANGVQDAGESTLEGIPMRLGNGHSSSGRDGQFAFVNVPVGTRSIGLDTGALPIDFDPPAVSQIQVELSRGDAKRVTFGLVPLGSIEGRIIRDVNGNGKADPNEEPIDGAVVVLDSGARSEQARKGQYRFEAVRSGTHLVKLLIDSLPEGAVIAGEAEVPAALSQGALSADVSFLVSVEKRPEIRRVFPSRGGTTSSNAAPARSSTGRGASAPAATAAAEASRNTGVIRTPAAAPSAAARVQAAETFAIQIAALNNPIRAKSLVQQLEAAGLPAYLVAPPPGEPDAPYRVRLGPYESRDEAQRVAARLEAQRGEKLWVVREGR